MSEPIVHIAGLDIRISNRLIQRCAVCGEKLIDVDLSRVGVPIEDAGRPYPVFPVGGLVEVDGNHFSVLSHDLTGKLPENNCLPLVEN